MTTVVVITAFPLAEGEDAEEIAAKAADALVEAVGPRGGNGRVTAGTTDVDPDTLMESVAQEVW